MCSVLILNATGNTVFWLDDRFAGSQKSLANLSNQMEDEFSNLLIREFKKIINSSIKAEQTEKDGKEDLSSTRIQNLGEIGALISSNQSNSNLSKSPFCKASKKYILYRALRIDCPLL